jgi:hypothetical protein
VTAQGHQATLVIFDETATSDDDNHYACCDDERIALCGTDLTEHCWITNEEQINCQTCIRLDQADAGWFASYDNEPCPHCPLNVLGSGGAR